MPIEVLGIWVSVLDLSYVIQGRSIVLHLLIYEHLQCRQMDPLVL